MPTVLRAFCSQPVVSRGVWKGPWVLGEPRVNLAAKKWELACLVAWQHCLAGAGRSRRVGPCLQTRPVDIPGGVLAARRQV